MVNTAHFLYANRIINLVCVMTMARTRISAVAELFYCIYRLRYILYLNIWNSFVQGDHLSGKPGNVREFDSCQGNVRDFTENQGNVRELSG